MFGRVLCFFLAVSSVKMNGLRHTRLRFLLTAQQRGRLPLDTKQSLKVPNAAR
ncbi:hypothetical protein RB12537 [Rhodopirellula baltica SH 1]|uniref:Uncharacterized protein n=1 Tax=Rhodopirellula baltica (strain DSM 10527 / NCIMB 13988 / SH1) TaxID=243090 RepID=Q7UIH0_RHOBA|nr:hypothetical protein RB12537 [Rhodopirellula baltica SH 1]